jgi:hypothetical protein
MLTFSNGNRLYCDARSGGSRLTILALAAQLFVETPKKRLSSTSLVYWPETISHKHTINITLNNIAFRGRLSN